MKTCIDKVCEGVLCDDECKDLKPSICGKNRELFAPENACGSIRIEGADDVEINQGVCIDLTEGVHAYDGNGREIEYEVEPSEIGCCDVGEHEVTYTAIGSSKEMIPYIRTSKPMLGFNACGLVVKKVKRLVTVLQALPPTIIGAVRTVLPIGASFDPMYGVSGIDDNGNATEVTFEGRYDVATDEADIVTFDSDVVQDLRSVKVSLEPIQNCTPWIGTEENNAPYLMRSVESIGVDVGNTQHDEIVGATVGWNQHVKNPNFVNTNDWNAGLGSFGTVSVANNEAIYTPTSIGTYYYNNQISQSGFDIPANHIVFISAETYAPYDHGFWMSMRHNVIGMPGVGISDVSITPNTWCKRSKVTKLTEQLTDIGFYWGMSRGDYTTSDVVKLRNPIIVDLTAMFGTVIADYVYSLEQATAGSGIAWLKSYGFFTKDYYPYNVGELTSVKPSAHKVVGFNQWDEEWELGTIDTNTGQNANNNSMIRSKNMIAIASNQEYYILIPYTSVVSGFTVLFFYDADNNYLSYRNAVSRGAIFTTPTNARYVRFIVSSLYGTTYNHDICVNISDPNRNGEYEPYISQSYPLDNSTEYRGLFKLDANNNLYADGDVYKSDDSVNRRYAIVDLGTLAWSRTASYANPFFFASISDIKQGANIKAVKYREVEIAGASYFGRDSANLDIASSGNSKQLFIRDDAYTDATAFKSSLSGVYMVYEKATPTTEQATPYESSQAIYEGGTEEYIDTRTVPIPVGHETRYALVCPIYGYDSVEVTRVGKNLFGGTALRDGLLGIPNATDHASDGYVSYWANTQAEHNITDGMTFKENTQYTFIYKMYRGSATGSGLRLYYKDGTYVSMPSPSENYGTEQLIITSAEGKTVDRLAYYKDNGSVRIYYNESGIFEGDLELEDFEPYQADTYTSPLPQTVYGGVLDVVSGELVVDRAMVDLGTLTFVKYGSDTVYYASVPNKANGNTNVLSDKFFLDAVAIANMADGSLRGYASNANVYFRRNDCATLAEWNTWLSNNPTQLCYELATPQSIQLTPQEVKSLIGENNVWSEDGKVQVVYSTPLEDGISQFDYDGVYPITYHTEDSCGNETDVTRYIVVGDNLIPDDTYGIACQAKVCYSVIECEDIETFRTVIYEDGTLIINESSNDKEANIAEHGQAVHVYEAMKSDGSNYVFTVSSEDLWRDFSVLYTIKRVEIGSHIQPISTANWFYNLYYCEEMDLTNLDTSRVTDMENMFRYVGYQSSETIQLLDLSHFDTRAVTNMKNVFNHMSHTKAIDVSSWDTSSATNMLGVFSYCDELVTIYASNLFVPINPREYGFFTDCYNLVGGSGTSYASIGGSEAAYSTYARLDNPPNEPGYFTEKQ